MSDEKPLELLIETREGRARVPATYAGRRKSRADLLKHLTYQFADLVTAVVGRCDLLADRLADPTLLADVRSIRQSAMKTAELNRVVLSLAEECRSELETT